jgi:hypothetical protein
MKKLKSNHPVIMKIMERVHSKDKDIVLEADPFTDDTDAYVLRLKRFDKYTRLRLSPERATDANQEAVFQRDLTIQEAIARLQHATESV